MFQKLNWEPSWWLPCISLSVKNHASSCDKGFWLMMSFIHYRPQPLSFCIFSWMISKTMLRCFGKLLTWESLVSVIRTLWSSFVSGWSIFGDLRHLTTRIMRLSGIAGLMSQWHHLRSKLPNAGRWRHKTFPPYHSSRLTANMVSITTVEAAITRAATPFFTHLHRRTKCRVEDSYSHPDLQQMTNLQLTFN